MNVSQLTSVYYVGSLGRAIGHKRLDLDVRSPAEAIRATNVITRGKLEEYLRGPGRGKHYKIALQRRDNVIDIQEASHPSGRSAIYIMPTVKGRDSAIGKIAAGVIILAAVYFTGGLAAGAAPGWAAAAGGGLSTAGTIAVGFGTSLVLGGITQLLTPTPKGPSQPTEQKTSTSFAGNATSVVQGGCVPLVYGRALVSPIPISITFDNNDIPTTDAGSEGVVTTDNLQGGGQQYSSATVL